MAGNKPRYRRAVAERYLDRPRVEVWRTALAAFGDPAGLEDPAARSTRTVTLPDGPVAVTQTIISLDELWRLVTDVADAPVPFHQEALVLMPRPARHAVRLGDQGRTEGCIAMLSVLVGPDDDADGPYAEAVAGEVEQRLDALLAH
ncbi:MAG: hypothetical protein HKN26_13905 [Acidimicrobiales bacterium]|nr:hypothetical protein [Acidimicrobiales bacterium]